MPTTIQLRVSPQFKETLEKEAEVFDLPTATYIKVLLANQRRRMSFLDIGKDTATKKEKREIKKAMKEYKEAKKKGKLIPFKEMIENADKEICFNLNG